MTANSFLREGKWAASWAMIRRQKQHLASIVSDAIGQSLARRASGFNMRLLANDLRPHSRPDAGSLGVSFVSLISLMLGRERFHFVHAALTPDSLGYRRDAIAQNETQRPLCSIPPLGAITIRPRSCVRCRKNGIVRRSIDAYAVEPMPAIIHSDRRQLIGSLLTSRVRRRTGLE